MSAEPAHDAEAVNAAAVWDAAIEKIRNASRWIGTSLAAVAAVIFGSGPIIQRFDSTLEGTQWRMVGLGLLAGFTGVIVVIAVLAHVQAPTIVTIDEAPRSLRDRLPRLCGIDVDTLAQFQSRWTAFQIVVDSDQVAVDAAQSAVNAATTDLGNLTKTPGSSAADITAAYATLTSARASAQAAAKDLATSTRSLDRLEAAATTMLHVARLARVKQTFRRSMPLVMLGTFLVVVGAVVYLAALGPEDEPNAGGGSSTPQLVTLAPLGENPLIDSLGIPQACRTALLLDGDGTKSPYQIAVSQAVDPDCTTGDFQFSATGEQLALQVKSLPKVKIIDETPEPETDWTWVWIFGLAALAVGAIAGVALGSEYVPGSAPSGAPSSGSGGGVAPTVDS